jgi:hypothetical protein
LARRRDSSMRRTCSGVMGWFVAGAGARGGVVGRSVPAMVVVVWRLGTVRRSKVVLSFQGLLGE